MLLNRRLLGMLVLACAAAACDDDTTPTAPSTPPPTVTTTITGSLIPNGAVTHTIEVSAGGAVTGTLKEIEDDTIPVSFGLGSWNGTTCTLVLVNDSATEGAVLNGSMDRAGAMCARMSDSGNVPAGTTVKYTIEVVHP